MYCCTQWKCIFHLYIRGRLGALSNLSYAWSADCLLFANSRVLEMVGCIRTGDHTNCLDIFTLHTRNTTFSCHGGGGEHNEAKAAIMWWRESNTECEQDFKKIAKNLADSTPVTMQDFKLTSVYKPMIQTVLGSFGIILRACGTYADYILWWEYIFGCWIYDKLGCSTNNQCLEWLSD